MFFQPVTFCNKFQIGSNCLVMRVFQKYLGVDDSIMSETESFHAIVGQKGPFITSLICKCPHTPEGACHEELPTKTTCTVKPPTWILRKSSQSPWYLLILL